MYYAKKFCFDENLLINFLSKSVKSLSSEDEITDDICKTNRTCVSTDCVWEGYLSKVSMLTFSTVILVKKDVLIFVVNKGSSHVSLIKL